MKCFALIVVVALCSAGAVLQELPSTRLNRFVGKLKDENQFILSRRVSAGFRDVSINDFYKISDLKLLAVDDRSPIAETDTHEVSYLFNIAVSCEYCDYMHHKVALIAMRIKQCYEMKSELQRTTVFCGPSRKQKLNAIENCYRGVQKDVFGLLRVPLPNMIITLLGLQQYNRNFVSKDQDLFKIMVTTFLFLKNHVSFEGKDENIDGETILNELKYAILVFNQIKLYLERFGMARCQTSRSARGSSSNQSAANYVPSECYRNVMFFKLIDFKDCFVTYSNSDRFDRLFNLVETSTDSPANSEGETFLKKLKTDYGGLIETTDVAAIVAFETKLLQTIVKIIICIAAEKLEHIEAMPKDRNKKLFCDSLIQAVLDENISTFKANGQPTYLTYKMTFVSGKLWFICNKMKSVNQEVRNDIERFRALALGYPYAKKYDLNAFLTKLSETGIFGILNPLVSNVFWAEMFYYDTDALNYMVDFKAVGTSAFARPGKDGDKMYCEDSLKTFDVVDVMDYALDQCDELVGNATTTSAAEACFKLYKSQCDLLDTKLTRMLETHFPRQTPPTEWRKLAILVRYNLDHMELFDVDVLKTIGARRVRDLRSFNCDVRNSLIALHYARCGCADELGPKRLLKTPPATSRKRDEPPPRRTAAAAGVEQTAFEKFHERLSGFAAKIVASDELDQDFLLYWEGGKTTLRDVVYRYGKRAFDLQDAFALQSIVAKWLLAAVYTRIRDIVDATIFFRRPLAEIHSSRLHACLGSAYHTLPLFLYGVSEHTIARFLEIVRVPDGSTVKQLVAYRRALDDELESIGVVPDSIPNYRDGVSERIASLETIVAELKKSNVHAHGSSLAELTKSLGIIENQIFRDIK